MVTESAVAPKVVRREIKIKIKQIEVPKRDKKRTQNIKTEKEVVFDAQICYRNLEKRTLKYKVSLQTPTKIMERTIFY